MKIDLNKQAFTKQEVVGILDEIQDRFIELWELHERYQRLVQDKSSCDLEKSYIAAYQESSRIVCLFKKALQD